MEHNKIRGWMRAAATSAALALPLAAAAQQAFTTDVLNLRAGPGVEYPIVATLSEGQPLEVMGCENGYDWCDVTLPDGLRGWVAASYLQFAYQGTPVPLASYAPAIGVPIVTFGLGAYWGNYYRDRPWYNEPRWWGGRPPPPPGPGWRPPPHPRPGWSPHPPPPGWRPPPHAGNPGRPPEWNRPPGGWDGRPGRPDGRPPGWDGRPDRPGWDGGRPGRPEGRPPGWAGQQGRPDRPDGRPQGGGRPDRPEGHAPGPRPEFRPPATFGGARDPGLGPNRPPTPGRGISGQADDTNKP